jgi:prepilin-type processing-associated H-X9-DG protein
MPAKPVPRRFTLVEVIIVAVILVIVAVMLLPMTIGSREKARRRNCAGNLKSLGLASLMYSGDYDGYFPNDTDNHGTDFGVIQRKDYMQDGKVWSCPSRTTVMTLASDSAYRYIGSGLKDDNKSATAVSLAYDQSNNHPNNAWCNVLLIDGHAEGGVPAKNPAQLGND